MRRHDKITPAHPASDPPTDPPTMAETCAFVVGEEPAHRTPKKELVDVSAAKCLCRKATDLHTPPAPQQPASPAHKGAAGRENDGRGAAQKGTEKYTPTPMYVRVSACFLTSRSLQEAESTKVGKALTENARAAEVAERAAQKELAESQTQATRLETKMVGADSRRLQAEEAKRARARLDLDHAKTVAETVSIP